ncbi:MAG TPA: polysaccharide pyruvyl transferase family protein [Tepidisphaeraceae bacterium]|nr:polysaccharide pyruvyl transferase family protein [Tepidisphaeraceae bacterium]
MVEREPVTRRGFLRGASIAGIAAAFGPHLSRAIAGATDGNRPPRILLRSAWQTVNIGDIGHTPGIVRLLEEYIPEAQVTLWPANVGDGVEEMLRRRFAKLGFAKSADEVKQAFAHSDFLLHGSGSGFVAQKQVAQWKKETGKPYGIYGISLASVSDSARDLLSASRFVFFRDSVSLGVAKAGGVNCPVMEFGPDGAFAVDLRNDAAATAFCSANGLEEGKFVCVIPRLRYTPYWKIRNKAPTAEEQKKYARSLEMKEHDHAPLREAIIAIARQTDMKVLACPEDKSQMAIGKEMLVDPLPEDVKKRVVWRKNYWLTDEAVSTYVRSAGLFGLEMHSPIVCVGNGVPAIVCRFAEQTTKGFMWKDIGLGDWLFDMDEPKDVERIVPTVLAMVTDRAGAKEKVEKAQAFVHRRQRETMGVLRQSL